MRGMTKRQSTLIYKEVTDWGDKLDKVTKIKFIKIISASFGERDALLYYRLLEAAGLYQKDHFQDKMNQWNDTIRNVLK
jgi:hypothetical protein